MFNPLLLSYIFIRGFISDLYMLYSLVYFIKYYIVSGWWCCSHVYRAELYYPHPTHLVSADKAQDGFKVLFIKLNFQLVLLA